MGCGKPSCALRTNAVEERDILLRFQEARYPLKAGAMLLRDEGGGVYVAGKPDLCSACVALQQKGFWASAAVCQKAQQNSDFYRPRYHAGEN